MSSPAMQTCSVGVFYACYWRIDAHCIPCLRPRCVCYAPSHRYKLITPKGGLMSWVRVMVANYLTSSGKEWSDTFSRENGGTYNNRAQSYATELAKPYQTKLTDDVRLTTNCCAIRMVCGGQQSFLSRQASH